MRAQNARVSEKHLISAFHVVIYGLNSFAFLKNLEYNERIQGGFGNLIQKNLFLPWSAKELLRGEVPSAPPVVFNGVEALLKGDWARGGEIPVGGLALVPLIAMATRGE